MAAETNHSNAAVVPDREKGHSFVQYAHDSPSRTTIPFTEREQQILQLHAQLSELQLEHALLDTQRTISQEVLPPVSTEEAEVQVKNAERECLKARSAQLLKCSIVENVLLSDPLLKSIHAGPHANLIERRLHPLIDQRDLISLAHTNLCADLQSTWNRMMTVTSETMVVHRHNRELTATMLELTDKLQHHNIPAIHDGELRSQLEELSVDVKESRRRYRIMKSLLAAVVANSGVDWARNDQLRELVLDAEE